MLTLYKILVNLIYAVMLPYFAYRRKRAPDEWGQRMARDPERYLRRVHDSAGTKSTEGVCLFHASSVGEVRVLQKLIDAVRKIRPNVRYCVSTYTTAGHKLAGELFPEAEAVIYFPLDCYFPLKRFLRSFNPAGVVFVETEIWPYFLDCCRRMGTPVILANGRISLRSAKWYTVFRSGLRPVLGSYRRLVMQTDTDRERIVAMGADPRRVTVLGNMKYDAADAVDVGAKRREVRQRLNIPEGKILLAAASTRPGEEEILCRALRGSSCFPERMVVLIAPRHLERLDEVTHILNDHDCPFTPFSRREAGEGGPTPVILMDQMGLLAELFYGADLAFVGGTLVDLGGHNIMEPALAGVPVLFGPSIFNVQEAAERIIREKLGMMVADGDQLSSAIKGFVDGSLSFEKLRKSESSVAEQTARVIIEEFGL